LELIEEREDMINWKIVEKYLKEIGYFLYGNIK